MDFSLIIPAFVAGILTFLAPCTLPLVPGYLGFISGVSAQDLRDPNKIRIVRKRIFLNGVFYVVGFSAVFVALGSLFGLGGSALFAYRVWLTRIGGIFVIFFGLFMMGLVKIPFLQLEKHLQKTTALRPGNPTSSLIFGATFAFGWTPCVGPILGSILALAVSSATVGQGALLLGVFSLGLGVPFLLIAASIGSATEYLAKLNKYLPAISFIGGLFLVFLGVLLVTNNFAVWIAYFYQFFDFLEYERILYYL